MIYQKKDLLKKRSFEFTKKHAFYSVILLMLVYFVFHSIYGRRGIIAYFKLQSDFKESEKKLELLRAERLESENRTKLLRPGSLDRDMLDEMTRNVLGFSSEKESVYKSTKFQKETNKTKETVGTKK